MNSRKNSGARRLLIQRQLLLDGAVSVEDLSQQLGVSLPTVRRDLASLEQDGRIRRTHGGAVVEAPRGADQAFALREQTDSEEKRAIARHAIRHIERDATVLMNDGSTVLAVAREIVANNLKVTVVTPGVNVALLLSECRSVTTYLLGGALRPEARSTIGDFAERMLASFNADIAFIAAEGFTAREGLSYSYEFDAALARIMHQRAQRTVVLATARKLTERDRVVALESRSVNTLITGCSSKKTLEPFRRAGIDVQIAGKDSIEPSALADLPLSSS